MMNNLLPIKRLSLALSNSGLTLTRCAMRAGDGHLVLKEESQHINR